MMDIPVGLFFWSFPVLSVILNGNAPFFYTNTEKQNFISFLFFAPLSVGHICRELFLLICWLFCVLLERQQFLEKYMSLAAFSEEYIGIFHSLKVFCSWLDVGANTLQTSAKRVLLSICRVPLSIMQILCKRVQREFTLNLPSAAKYYANISFISNKYKLNWAYLCLFVCFVLEKLCRLFFYV